MKNFSLETNNKHKLSNVWSSSISTLSNLDLKKVAIVIVLPLTILLTILFTQKLFLHQSKADNPTYPHGPVEASNVSLTNSGDVEMEIDPTPTGNNIAIESNTTTVSTNNTTGYSLTLNTDSPTNNNLTHTSPGLESFQISSISPSNTPLKDSSWGYTATDPTNNPTTTNFNSVPTSTSPATIKSTEQVPANEQQQDDATLYYGAKVVYSDIPAGQYGNTVMYTALTNPNAPPTVTIVNPSAGLPAGGETITLVGTNFDSIVSIAIDSKPCTNIQITSATTATCTTPANAVGAYDVAVTGQGGDVVVEDGYIYANPPTVAGITPDTGSISGGTEVTITGTDFGTYIAPEQVTVDYNTCGSPQVFTAPKYGSYKLEAWGAGSGKAGSGSGGYTTGEVTLNVGDTVYIYVGCQGQAAGNVPTLSYVFNGGAYFHDRASGGADSGGGGGATDFRLISGDWDNLTSLQSRILVAGGGGGGYSVSASQHGNQNGTMNGGQNGVWNTSNCAVGNGQDFGKGGARNSSDDYGGGGGGWYGGCSWGDSGSGGGSPYVFTADSDKTGHGGNVPNSRFYIRNSAIAVGNTIMPDPVSSNTTMTTGKQGGGYARITYNDWSSNVLIGDSNCEIKAWTNTSITCTTTEHAAETVDVIIYNSNRMNGVLVDGFTYSPPTITSITPNQGSSHGGTEVTIEGANFGKGTAYDTTIVVDANYDTCGSPQAYTVSEPGVYKLEAWGAGSGKDGSGSGGYTAGEVNLDIGDTIYTYVGCQGVSSDYTESISYVFNGGAYIHSDESGTTDSGGGGGATDFRLVNGDWDNLTSLQSRILVAGGGGGGYSVNATQHGNQNGTMNGGQNGAWDSSYCEVDNGQGDFGKGGAKDNSDDYGGGGGGWYGGCSWDDSGSGGGSPYVFTADSDKTGYSGNVPDSRFYISNSTITIGGDSMPSPYSFGDNMESGKQGDGYARISRHTSVRKSSVSVGGSDCTITSWNDTSITCVTPAHEVGAVDVIVTEDSGASTVFENGYTYIPPPTPNILSIAPTSGSMYGGTEVTITGTDFGEYRISPDPINYTTCGSPQTFTAVTAGAYKLEAWGAGSGKASRGSGGYTSGEVTLNAGDTIHVYVGCQGQTAGLASTLTYVFNGGAYIHTTSGGDSGGGGGATDFRLANGSWDDLTSLQSRILVAGGGASGYNLNTIQHGNQNGTMNGGQNGTWNSSNCAVDNGRGDFGKGGAKDNSDDYGGGGGGWYGGCSWGDSNAGGGSPYVFTSTSDKTGYGSNTPNSRFYISNSTITVGNTSMPDPTAPGATMTNGRQGNGYARITPLGGQGSAYSSVTVGGKKCEVSSWSGASITCITTAHTDWAGMVDVTVSSSNGTSGTLSDGFTYLAPAPTITDVVTATGAGVTANHTVKSNGEWPNAAIGTARTTRTVAITGTNFTNATAVTVGGTACTNFTVNSATSITCTIPTTTKSGNQTIVVTTPGGTTTSTATAGTNAITYVAAPTVSSVAYTTAKTNGQRPDTLSGTTWTAQSSIVNTINGTNLNGGGFATSATVSIGGTCGSYSITSATAINCNHPSWGSAGTKTVQVTNAYGASGTATSVTAVAAPTISSISPNTDLAVAGGTTITLTGTNYNSSFTTTVGGTNCTTKTYSSATKSTCVTPAKGAGTTQAVVTRTPYGTSGSVNVTYELLKPTVTSISPNSGHFRGGETFTITGTNFTGATKVNFDNSNCRSFTVNSATQITCVSSGVSISSQTDTDDGLGPLMTNATSTASVYVTTPNGTNATNSLFTYRYPNSSFLGGQTYTHILGTDMVYGSKISIGGTNCTQLSIGSKGTRAVCNSPTISTTGSKTLSITAPAAATGNMQNFSEVCNASKVGTIRILTDNRDSQKYRVRCMEDNKWWMIDNLKLAGGTTLSASNTNLDNTTDAAFITAWKSLSAQSTVTSTTAPTWRDATDNINTYTNCQPGVPGVSSDSLTGCGYLYNWFAATAGRGIGSISTGDVAASICPVGWHLPSAGTGGATTTNEFAVLNGAMSGNASPVITNNTTTRPKWKSNGPFQGVYAGYWDGTSRNQGGNGYYWSSSAYSANSARILGFYHNRVNPGSGNYTKWYGLSVRCVL